MSEEVKTVGRPPNTKIFKCECPNIHTSKGKVVRGQEIELPAKEVAVMEKAQKRIIDELLTRLGK